MRLTLAKTRRSVEKALVVSTEIMEAVQEEMEMLEAAERRRRMGEMEGSVR